MPSPLVLLPRGTRAVLFDLFHTLTSIEATSAGDGLQSTPELLGVTPDAWSAQLARTAAQRWIAPECDPLALVASMARAIDPSLPQERIERATAARAARFRRALTHPPSRSLAALDALRDRGLALALVSNADAGEVAAWPESPLAPRFDTTVFSCVVGVAKPAPGIYQAALDALGVPAAQAAFVGDGGGDELRGARAVGLFTVLVTGFIRDLWPERIPERRLLADLEVEEVGALAGAVALPGQLSPPHPA